MLQLHKVFIRALPVHVNRDDTLIQIVSSNYLDLGDMVGDQYFAWLSVGTMLY